MSHWTYVTGTVRVEIPFQTVVKDRVKDYIEWSIKQLKKKNIDITGSEGPANFFVNVFPHPSLYSSETGDSWSYGFITIAGSLRDREDSETIKEVKNFIKYLDYFMDVDDVMLEVSGDNKTTINTSYYAEIYACDDTWNENEKFRDKLYNIRFKNKHRFFDAQMTLEKAADIAEFITNVSPDTLEGLLCNFGIDRHIDWDYTDRMKSWYKDRHVTIRQPDDLHFKEWFKKRKYPKSPTIEELRDELCDLAYNADHYALPHAEQKKISKLYRIVNVASRSKTVTKTLAKWD